MHGVLVGAAALACPVGMGLMMWFMAKGKRGEPDGEPVASRNIEALREEHRRLGEQIERLTDAEHPITEPAEYVRS